MDEHDWLAEQFEANRTHLGAVAYRMLGSRSEADDAVQESWLHLRRSGTSGVQNLGGWLTTDGRLAGVPGHAALAPRGRCAVRRPWPTPSQGVPGSPNPEGLHQLDLAVLDN